MLFRSEFVMSEKVIVENKYPSLIDLLKIMMQVENKVRQGIVKRNCFTPHGERYHELSPKITEAKNDDSAEAK